MSLLEIDPKLELLFETDKRYILLSSGRGPGKSHGVGTLITDLTYEPGHRVLYTRWTMASAELSIIPEFLEKVELFEDTGHIENARSHFKHIKGEDRIINLSSGSDVLFRGLRTSQGNQTANLKSLKGVTTWVIEEAEELINEEIFDTIDNSIRKTGIDLRVIIIWNPSHKKHWIWKRFFEDRKKKHDFHGEFEDTAYIYMHYLDNLDNLAQSFLDKAEKVKRMNKKRYDYIYGGKPKDENDLALWKQSTMIDPYRVQDIPDLKRIVVGVDPNVKNKKNIEKQKIDDAGLVVCGISYKGHYYVLHDGSGDFGPSEWGKLAVGLYKNWEADRIVAEANNGGDLVKMNIKIVDRTIPVKLVHASRGKIIRAEPVSALYEDGLVHHVGTHVELEDEMTSYTGDPREPSPNRLDALVWAMFELSQNEQHLPSGRSL